MLFFFFKQKTAYEILEDEIGFAVGEYDPSLSLVIDPVITYSSYLGSTGTSSGAAIAVDNLGNTYISGNTNSASFPLSKSMQGSLAGDYDVFVTKFNPAANALVYSTYIGGTNYDGGTGIAVNAAGNAFVTGMTLSSLFPTSHAIQSTFG